MVMFVGLGWLLWNWLSLRIGSCEINESSCVQLDLAIYFGVSRNHDAILVDIMWDGVLGEDIRDSVMEVME